MDKEKANFNSMKIGRSASFQGSNFFIHADFSFMEVKGSFYIDELEIGDKEQITVFHGPTNFCFSKIDNNFVADKVEFGKLGENYSTCFHSMNIGMHVFLRGAIFKGSADFHLMQIKGDLVMHPIIAEEIEKMTRFQGSVSLSGISVGGDLQAQEVLFGLEGQEHHFNFDGLTVDKSASFRGACFIGNVDFSLMDIKESFIISQLEKPNGSKNTILQGEAFFGGAKVGLQFLAEKAQFGEEGKKQKAIFDGLKVGRDAFFRGSKFHGPVNFFNANIFGIAYFEGAQFLGLGEDGAVNFIKFNSSDTFFSGAKFNGPANFSSSTIKGNLSFSPLNQNNQSIPTIFQDKVTFVGAEIEKQFNVQEAHFEKDDVLVKFNNMLIGQNAFFEKTIFKSKVSFLGAHIGGQFILKIQNFIRKVRNYLIK